MRTNSSDLGDMFERITQSFYTNIVRAGDTVIDGGAHTGRHTIPLARVVGPDGMVIAFEPLAKVAETLRSLLARFGFDSACSVTGRGALERAGQA